MWETLQSLNFQNIVKNAKFFFFSREAFGGGFGGGAGGGFGGGAGGGFGGGAGGGMWHKLHLQVS